MATFQALMALSATQTKESQSAVQVALVQRQRKEELRRKQQEQQQRVQQEVERKLRMKHFEDQKREEERKSRAEEIERAKEAALQRREDEQRDALRYGPKKAKSISSTSGSPSPKWPSSSSQNRTREEVRRLRLPDDEDDDAPEFLTREEKRERKQQQEMRRLFNTSKRSSHTSGYSKSGKRLPGGAVDITTMSQASDASSASKSVKERLAAMPNTLTKLNTVKRDTRTIDEILQDRAKAKEGKVLDGDEAREFTDWFSSSKKGKDGASKSLDSPAVNSGANTPSSRKYLLRRVPLSFHHSLQLLFRG
jgi:protein SPT2